MQAITEKQELKLDNSHKYYGELCFERPDGYIVKSKNIYLYGDVDFNNEEDLDSIEQFDFLAEPSFIESNFDYNKGCFTTIDGIAKRYETNNVIDWFKYHHCLIGKPQKIIVYKYKEL